MICTIIVFFQNDIWLKPHPPVKSIEALGDYAFFWFLQIGKWTFISLFPFGVVTTLLEFLIGGVHWKFAKRKRTPFDSVTQGFSSLPGYLGRILPFLVFILVFVWAADYAPYDERWHHQIKSLIGWSFGALGLTLIGGAVEFGLSRFQFVKSLSMSMQEVRDEVKETDGDPHMKQLRAALHRSLTYEEAVARIRKSSVVVVG